MAGHLADELQIRSLITHISWQCDEAPLEEYAANFTADGSWEHGEEVNVGPSRIAEASSRRRQTGVAGPGTATRHLVTPMTVDVDGDTASAVSYLQFFGDTHDTARVLNLCVYYDDLVRLNGTWKIKRRRVVIDEAPHR